MSISFLLARKDSRLWIPASGVPESRFWIRASVSNAAPVSCTVLSTPFVRWQMARLRSTTTIAKAVAFAPTSARRRQLRWSW